MADKDYMNHHMKYIYIVTNALANGIKTCFSKLVELNAHCSKRVRFFVAGVGKEN